MSDQRLIANLTLAMLQLTSWEEYGARRSWRSYNWDALDALYDAGLIYGNKKNKSSYLSEEGSAVAERLIEALREVGALDAALPAVPEGKEASDDEPVDARIQETGALIDDICEEAQSPAPIDAAFDGDAREDEDADFDLELVTKKNEEYLDEFEQWLVASGLKPKTIRGHVNNVALFLQDYLAEREGEPMEEGPASISWFMGDFFIRKCMWSSPDTIRQTAASLKKFYKCMAQLGHVSQADFEFVKETIKDELPEWQDECRAFDSGESCGWFM